MKQITEDYCNFEIAQFLKEKGFDESVNRFYELSTGEPIMVRTEFTRNSYTTSFACPTHQMALKWLREVHKINIVIGVASDDDNLYSLWKFDIWNGNYSIIWGDKREKFNSYEQAVEAAILYVLKNLI